MSGAAPVTIVAHDIGPVGGMEMTLRELITGLLQEGREVTAIARTCEVPDHELLRKIRVPGPKRPFPLFYAWFALAGGVLLARHRRGVVHATGAIVPNAVDITTIHYCHRAYNALGGPLRAGRDTLPHRISATASAAMSRFAERLVYRPGRVRAVVAISHGVQREMEQWFPALAGRVRTIPHGVDLARFRVDQTRRAVARAHLRLERDDLAAIFVGGDWRRKGLEHAIRAVAAAPEWQLLVVGRGDEAAFAEIARLAGCASRVRFLGPSRDTSVQFAAADAFVLPTTYETFSLVTYEAAASGLPLLVTRVSGPDQLIREGVNGWFVDDSPARTAALLRELGDAALRARMGEAARRSAEPYTWPAAVAGHTALYDELAA